MNTRKVMLTFLVLGIACVFLVPGTTLGSGLEYEIICPPNDGTTWGGKFSDEPLKKNIATGKITRILDPVKRAIAEMACKNAALLAECVDNDGDGYGVGTGCLGPDCDDNNADVNPGAAEGCDGIDNDCDGEVDEGCIPTCIDIDGDGYGVGAICLGPDCDDNNADVNPGVFEIVDGIDNDCDGEVDECTPAVCPDDIFENNDLPADAANLSLPASESNLKSISGDPDWFTFVVEGETCFNIHVVFQHAGSGAECIGGGGNIDIYLYDVGLGLLEESRSETDDENIEYCVAVGDIPTFYLEVRMSVEGCNPYDLSITFFALP